MIRLKYRYTKRGVPVLRNEEIEEHVERLLADYKPELLTKPQPLDVDDFVEFYIKLNIHFENLSHNGTVLGMMVYNDRQIPVYVPELNRAEHCPIDANTIVIDNSLLHPSSKVLYRSTVQHECGRGIYHRKYYEENDSQISLFNDEPTERIAVAVCRKSDVVGGFKRKFNTDREHMEHHAKYFSAASLMPRPAMRIACEEYKHRLSNGKFGDDYFKEEILVRYIAETFIVSPASARIRIEQLKLGFDKQSNNKGELFYLDDIPALVTK